MPGVDQGITHSLPETNQFRLNALEEQFRAKKERPCHAKAVLAPGVEGDTHTADCICGGARTITDPRIQAAWELVTEPWRPVPHGEVQRMPRMVEYWPDGAVRGLLEDACGKLGADAAFRKSLAAFYKLFWLFDPNTQAWQLRWLEPDAASLAKAILQALDA